MEISGGTRFKSRNNTNLLIYNMDAGGSQPIHGAYWSGSDEGWMPLTWTADGFQVEGERRPLDIIWDNTLIAA